eukprot:PhM_4_TR12467/c0_g1_i1/m.79166
MPLTNFGDRFEDVSLRKKDGTVSAHSPVKSSGGLSGKTRPSHHVSWRAGHDHTVSVHAHPTSTPHPAAGSSGDATWRSSPNNMKNISIHIQHPHDRSFPTTTTVVERHHHHHPMRHEALVTVVDKHAESRHHAAAAAAAQPQHHHHTHHHHVVSVATAALHAPTKHAVIPQHKMTTTPAHANAHHGHHSHHMSAATSHHNNALSKVEQDRARVFNLLMHNKQKK